MERYLIRNTHLQRVRSGVKLKNGIIEVESHTSLALLEQRISFMTDALSIKRLLSRDNSL